MSTRNSYGVISRFNHWIIALAMIGMLGFGLFLEYGDVPRQNKGWLIGIHKAIGVLVLIYGTWRVCWRLFRGFPAAIPGMPGWQERASKLAHWLLMAGIIIMPLSGVLWSIFGGRTIRVFDWFSIPAQSKIEWLSGLGGTVHEYVGIGLTIIVLGHIAAALKHHFIDRDATLVRMVSGRSERRNP